MSTGDVEISTLSNEWSDRRKAVATAQRNWIKSASVDIGSSWVRLEGGSTVHYLSAGEGEPVILLHGSGNSCSDWVPLMEQPIGRQYLAVDRPGFGLSDKIDFEPGQLRDASVGFLSDFLDAMDLESADLVGNSGGSVTALWMAIDRPQRVRSLCLLGATPLLPGTRVPFPLKVMTSAAGSLLSRLMPEPSPETVVKMMGAMGESESIIGYPGLIDVYVAAASDPDAAEASGRELAEMIRGLRGFRPEVQFEDLDLAAISQASILIWGDRDPVGGKDAARLAADLLPDSELHLVPAGHAPWWREPGAIAPLLSTFYGRFEGGGR